MAAMPSQHEMKFVMRCRFGKHDLHLSLPLSSSTLQLQFLHALSDACSSFLLQLTPQDVDITGKLEKSLTAMEKLREKVLRSSFNDRDSSVLEPVVEDGEAELEAASPVPRGKEQERSFPEEFAFPVLQEADGSSESDDEDVVAPKRQQAIRPGDLEDIVKMDSELQSALCAQNAANSESEAQAVRQTHDDFRTVVSSAPQCASQASIQSKSEGISGWTKASSQMLSAMRRVSLPKLTHSRASKASKILPDPSESLKG
eukprot:TRINITY_DN27581_c0_g1_i1.p1 TRINITY_DN27581_c0_g1~~TRINITY_DN27581_c0_g1_i1.p1  ORF type:complete len:258 (-),score=61.59 TRINITY_DN27581_c0_g1_i1:76-849(-)